jgi:hypothetical protein
VGHRNVANARAQYGGPRREDRALLDPDGWPCGFRASAPGPDDQRPPAPKLEPRVRLDRQPCVPGVVVWRAR